MPLPKSNNYTIEDIYSLPDGQRAELIDGQIYDMAPPSPFQQELVMELSATLRDYIKKNSGSCKVYPAPFAVFLLMLSAPVYLAVPHPLQHFFQGHCILLREASRPQGYQSTGLSACCRR